MLVREGPIEMRTSWGGKGIVLAAVGHLRAGLRPQRRGIMCSLSVNRFGIFECLCIRKCFFASTCVLLGFFLSVISTVFVRFLTGAKHRYFPFDPTGCPRGQNSSLPLHFLKEIGDEVFFLLFI